MTDRFAPALIDLRDALLGGDDIETALSETAADHSLPVVALTNRARIAFGDLSTYAARREALEARAIREDQIVRDFFRQNPTAFR